MKVAIIGSNGQLGHSIANEFTKQGHTVHGLTHEQIEVANLGSVRFALAGLSFDILVNTAWLAMAESEKDPSKAYLVNAIGAKNLAAVARANNALFVQISTNAVFCDT